MAVNTKERPPRLEQMWKQAIDDFYEITAKDLRKKSTQLSTFESVVQQIESTPIEDDPKRSARDTKTKLKDATLDAIKCIQLLGGIAAQAASATFPASGLCFNAVSFLLDAPVKIASLYAKLTELFQIVGTFLKQFKIFERIEKSSDIDPALLETVHQLLLCFVRICALSIKLLHGGSWTQAKVYLKIALLDKDSGVGDELNKLKRLSQAQDSITQSLTLEAALKSDKKLTDLLLRASETGQNIEDVARSIRNVTVGMDFLVDAEKDKVRQKQLDSIKAKFDIEKLLNDSDKQYRDAETKQVKGTGSWLLEQGPFQKWIEPVAKGTQFLLLVGKKNVGKSFLIPAISEHIRAQKKDAKEQIAIAKYCFPPNIDRSGNKLPQIQQAFKCLAYQLAQENKVYAKELAAICKDELNQLSGEELWKTLKFEEAMHGTTFILILDGIDQLHSANSEELFGVLADLKTANDAMSSGLRILLSGPESSLKGRLLEREPTIEVAEHNSEDVKKYIERSLEEADVLRGDEEEVVNLRNLVIDKLPSEAGNDFYKMDIAIREIGSERYLDEAGVHRVLDKAGAEIKEILRRGLQQLNETLDPQSITELNELLTWVLCFTSPLTVKQLKAAQALGHEKTAIRPLKKILKDDYGTVFEIDEDEYVTVSSEIRECLILERRQDAGSRMEKEEGAQRTVTITKEEINMLSNFIKAFVEPETFEKFGFEPFFQSKGDAQIRVGVNMKDAQAFVISTLLQVFQNDKDEKTSDLGIALGELPHLLKPERGIGELSELDSKHKSMIGSRLIGFLSQRVDYWVGKYGYETPYDWLEDDDALDTLWRWLKDPTVVKASGQTETQWIDAVTDSNAKYQLLKPVALSYARQWLQDPTWESWDGAFSDKLRVSVYWIQNYIIRERLSKKETDNLKFEYQPIEGTIATSASWAEKELQIEQRGSLWYERLGYTYLRFSEREDAMKTFIDARERDLSTTTINEQLAKLYAESGKYAEAIDYMKGVVKDLKTVDDPSDKDTDRLRGDVHDLIQWYSKIREPEIAMKWCEEALKYDKEKYRVYRTMIKTLFENDRIEEAAALLLEWSRQDATDYELSMLEAMQYDFASYCIAKGDYDDENGYFHAIVGLAQQIEKYDAVLDAMKKAVDFAKRRKEDEALGVLLLYRGSAFKKPHLGKDGLSSALRDWHDCRMVTKRSKFSYVGFQATRNIGLYHFMEAIHPQHTCDEKQEHVRTLEAILKESKSDSNIWISDEAVGYFEALLAIYYRSMGDDAKARQLLQREIKNCLDMLSDEWAYNDWYAYRTLAMILARYGDDCNSLSAWSLLAPSDAGSESPSLKRQGDLNTTCEGRCNTTWTYANDFWRCKYCQDVAFDSECLEKLRAGKLMRDVCSPHHQFFHVPKWSDDEFRAVGKDHVRMGGEIQPDGMRTGGEIVTVDEWKNKLYEEWDIQKPAKSEEEKTEEKDKDAGEEGKEKDDQVKEDVFEKVMSLSTEQPTVVEMSVS